MRDNAVAGVFVRVGLQEAFERVNTARVIANHDRFAMPYSIAMSLDDSTVLTTSITNQHGLKMAQFNYLRLANQ